MQFGPVRDKFAEMMTGFLKDTDVVLELKFNSVMADEASIASISTLDAEWLISLILILNILVDIRTSWLILFLFIIFE